MTENLVRVLIQFEVLSGNRPGESGRAWQDEARVLVCELDGLAARVRAAIKGAGIVFPSPVELVEEGLEK